MSELAQPIGTLARSGPRWGGGLAHGTIGLSAVHAGAGKTLLVVAAPPGIQPIAARPFKSAAVFAGPFRPRPPGAVVGYPIAST